MTGKKRTWDKREMALVIHISLYYLNFNTNLTIKNARMPDHHFKNNPQSFKLGYAKEI